MKLKYEKRVQNCHIPCLGLNYSDLISILTKSSLHLSIFFWLWPYEVNSFIDIMVSKKNKT